MSLRLPLRRVRVSYLLGLTGLFLISTIVVAQNVAGQQNAEQSPASQATQQTSQEQSKEPQSSEPKAEDQQSQQDQQDQQDQEAQAPLANYDQAIFQKPIPADQLAFLNQFAGGSASDLVRHKPFRKLMRNALPDCMFHYGHDMPLIDAMESVLHGSSEPVQLRDGRYLLVSGHSGPYLLGRGFVWFDLKDGIALGGFYFHPTNGEPTPAVNIFSRQVKEEYLTLGQLPPAFAEDLSQWSAESRVPPVTTRYFITGENKKILLEHDEDYCNGAGTRAANDCEQMNADAADIDMNAAYYLEQTNHATNATAWMITGEDQVAWLRVRDNTCRIGFDPLRCQIRITRVRVHVILRRHPVVHIPVHTSRR
jgi:uncharacterized protein YecT (DUF1311 family)